MPILITATQSNGYKIMNGVLDLAPQIIFLYIFVTSWFLKFNVNPGLINQGGFFGGVSPQ